MSNRSVVLKGNTFDKTFFSIDSVRGSDYALR